MSDHIAEKEKIVIGNRFVYVYKRFKKALLDKNKSVYRKIFILLIAPLVFTIIPITYLLSSLTKYLKKLYVYLSKDSNIN